MGILSLFSSLKKKSVSAPDPKINKEVFDHAALQKRIEEIKANTAYINSASNNWIPEGFNKPYQEYTVEPVIKDNKYKSSTGIGIFGQQIQEQMEHLTKQRIWNEYIDEYVNEGKIPKISPSIDIIKADLDKLIDKYEKGN